MAGWNTIKLLRSLEERTAKIGLYIRHSRFGFEYERENNIDVVGLYPAEDCLPQYSRDSEVYTGTLEDVKKFVDGIEWARQYDEMLGLSSETKRSRKEQNVRNKQLADAIKKA